MILIVMISCCLCFDCCCNDNSSNEQLVRQQQAMVSVVAPATGIHYMTSGLMEIGDTVHSQSQCVKYCWNIEIDDIACVLE